MNTEITLAASELKEALPGLTKIIGRSRSACLEWEQQNLQPE